LLTGWVAGGASPPPRWLALLRSVGMTPERRALDQELGRHLLPASLHGELGRLLADPGMQQPANLLLGLGSDAAAHAAALRAGLENRDTFARAQLAACVGALAPATRDCVPLLLPCLAEAHQQTVLPALLALVEIGDLDADGIDAVASCLQHPLAAVRLDALAALGALRASGAAARIQQAAVGAPEPFVRLATFVLATFAADAPATEDLLRELGDGAPHRWLVAAANLRTRALTAPQLVEGLEAFGQQRNWLAFAYKRCTRSMLVRKLVADCKPFVGVEVLAGWDYSHQDRARICRWLATDAEHGAASLRSQLLSVDNRQMAHDQLFVLHGIAAGGRAAGHWSDLVAPFVHHPEVALRDAATACLREIAGDDAITAARAAANPWPDWLALTPGSGRTVDPAAFVRDATKPKAMRAAELRRVRTWPGSIDPLVGLLFDENDELAEAAAQLCLRLRYGVEFEPAIVRAFAGGSAAVRRCLGAGLRYSNGLPWQLPAILAVLARPDATHAVTPDGSMESSAHLLEAMALQHMRIRRLRPPAAWMLQRLEEQPSVALWVMRTLPEPPEPELVPKLAQLGRSPKFAAVVSALLSRPRDGAPLPQSQGSTPWVLPPVPSIPQPMRAIQRELLWLLAQPWSDRGADLAAARMAARLLWQRASADQREYLHPLLRVMGPHADFAADDLAADLARRPARVPGQAADTLVAIGRADKVREWLQRLPIESPPQYGPNVDKLVHEVWAARLMGTFVECADAEVEARSAALLPHWSGLTAAHRDAVFLRLLAHAEANGGRVADHLASMQPLSESACASVEAFFARRRALPNRPDAVAEAVARTVFPSVPDLVLPALREGMVRFEGCLQFADVREAKAPIRAIADQLVDAAAATRERAMLTSVRLAGPAETDPQLGALLGRVLHDAGVAPIERLLAHLADPDTRQFALATLEALGPAAAAAVDPVVGLIENPQEPLRVRAAHVLARLGSNGVLRLCACVDRDPTLLSVLTYAVTQGDDASRAEVARWLGLMPRQGSEPLVEALKQKMPSTVDEHSRVAMVLALLQYEYTPTRRDWLDLINYRTAVIRRRIVDAYAPHARDLLAWGVLAELLADDDPGVRAAAAAALLAAPERITACRRPLAEFAAVAPAELAARIRTAVAK
jgi:hypothetical protein